MEILLITGLIILSLVMILSPSSNSNKKEKIECSCPCCDKLITPIKRMKFSGMDGANANYYFYCPECRKQIAVGKLRITRCTACDSTIVPLEHRETSRGYHQTGDYIGEVSYTYQTCPKCNKTLE